jgi:hypothetical protein
MIALLILLWATQGVADTGTNDAEDRLMAKIEKMVKLPQGAAPIKKYRRHYTWTDDGRTVWAVYALGGRPARLWLPREDMPIYLHGGCNVVSFDFDVDRNSASNITCY